MGGQVGNLGNLVKLLPATLWRLEFSARVIFVASCTVHQNSASPHCDAKMLYAEFLVLGVWCSMHSKLMVVWLPSLKANSVCCSNYHCVAACCPLVLIVLSALLSHAPRGL